VVLVSGSEENEPIPPDETEIVEEGDRPTADAPVKGDETEVVPLSIQRDEGKRLDLSKEAKRRE
jgi:hypothetical protein